MKNIRVLTRDNDILEVRDYAVFFEHDGMRARLDWELSNKLFEDSTLRGPDLENHIARLMIIQMQADFDDEITVAELREHSKKNPDTTQENIERFLNDGYVEQPTGIAKQLVEKFGDE